MIIYTIGHSTRSFVELVNLVEDQGAWPLIDIRSLPGSRRYPHFNKENLEDRLGDRYLHLPDLGGRRKVKDSCCDLDNGGWRVTSFRHYANYMSTPRFSDGMGQLEDIGEGTIMCSEAVWWRCHRRMVSDALVVRGHKVIHVGATADREHTLTDFAVTDPLLHYPAASS